MKKGLKKGSIIRIRDAGNFSYGENIEDCERLRDTGYKGIPPIIDVIFSETHFDSSKDYYVTNNISGVVCQYSKSENQRVCRGCPLTDTRKIQITDIRQVQL